MRQYELAIRIAQVHHLVDERKYKKALAVIQTLDMRQVRSLSDLKVFAEVYTRTEQYEAAKATYLRIYRRSKTRRVLYRLIYLSIRTNALDDAEAYYQEFVRMNPNARDALILRYRIDKAAGVPIGQLIEILQELKQEEYIEEWAYELAKLYHRAGRREECLEECEDILLWFGSGEIVERAKILIDHLQEKDPIPYYDDKDFTVPKKEEPNPDDTGSLPDLNEFIKERKAQKREERRVEREARRAEKYEEDYDAEEDEEERNIFDDEIEKESDEGKEEAAVKRSSAQEQKAERKKAEKVRYDAEDEFIDDYSDDDFETDGIDLSQKAKDGIQKLSGLFGFGKRDEEEVEEPDLKRKEDSAEKKTKSVSKPEYRTEKEMEKPEKKKPEYVPHSQSGTGITQDLAREISAIYEMEHREQLKEKAVTVINEVPNLATNVVDRMTQAIQKSATRSYIPLDIEEIQKEDSEETQNTDLQDEKQAKEPQGLKEQEKELASTEVQSEEQAKEPESTEVQEQAKEIESAETPDEEPETVSAAQDKSETELLKDLLEEEIHDPEEDTKDLSEEIEQTEQEEPTEEQAASVASELEHYQAPDIPVVETDYMELPEMSYEDLPTTRALQRSFQDVLHLIAGELDPSHFVLMGEGEDRIIGVAKQITRVMKESGYLSAGRIAKIHAQQLNKMDLINFRKQLRGNCLLIENASDLLFPTISKIFSIMEEYYGDFVVILADEGTTLDQLFRFVPVLGRKFKYIIDISKYTEDDYK